MLLSGQLGFSQFEGLGKVSPKLPKENNAVFEENKGQMKDQFWKPRTAVLYYGTSGGMNYYIKNSGMSYQLSRIESWKDEEAPIQNSQVGAEDCKQVPDQIGTYRVDAECERSFYPEPHRRQAEFAKGEYRGQGGALMRHLLLRMLPTQ
jgi:hypothetical protein